MTRRGRLDYIGPIPAVDTGAEPAGGVLDTVDIWLAATLQSLFNLIKR